MWKNEIHSYGPTIHPLKPICNTESPQCFAVAATHCSVGESKVVLSLNLGAGDLIGIGEWSKLRLMILMPLFLIAAIVVTLLGEVYVVSVAAVLVALSMLTSSIVFHFTGHPTKS